MAEILQTTFKLRRGSAETWEGNNPVLEYGEPGFDKDNEYLKIGNGEKKWLELEPIGKTIQPNWEQWDETAKDYIKNKPCGIHKYYPYAADVYEYDVEDITKGYDCKGYFTYPDTPVGGWQPWWGNIRILCNGETFLSDWKEMPNQESPIFISYGTGNFSILFEEEEDTLEPFLLVGNRKSSKIYFKESGHYKIEIFENQLKEENIHLSKDFLPLNLIPFVNNLKTNNENSLSFISSFNPYKDARNTICIGKGTKTINSDIQIFGSFNKELDTIYTEGAISSSGDGWWRNYSDQIFVVGNGKDDENRSNAFTISIQGEPWSQGRPQFGGEGHNKNSQTVVANGDNEIILKCGEDEYIIDVTSNGVLKAVKNVYRPQYKCEVSQTSSYDSIEYSLKLFLKGLNKKLINSAKIEYWIYYQPYDGETTSEHCIKELKINNSPDLGVDYLLSYILKSTYNEGTVSISGQRFILEYKNLENEDQVFSFTPHTSITTWTNIEE